MKLFSYLTSAYGKKIFSTLGKQLRKGKEKFQTSTKLNFREDWKRIRIRQLKVVFVCKQVFMLSPFFVYRQKLGSQSNLTYKMSNNDTT